MKYLLFCMLLVSIAPCMVFSQDQTATEELITSPEQISEPQTGKDAFAPPAIIGYDLAQVDFIDQSSFFMLTGMQQHGLLHSLKWERLFIVLSSDRSICTV